MSLMHDGWFSTGTSIMIGVGFLSGLAFDGLHWWLRPSVENPPVFRGFAFLLPIILYTLYYLAIFLFGGGVWWSVHLWMGSIILSGLAGYLLSYTFLPPTLAEG
jgi:hypothetical protein